MRGRWKVPKLAECLIFDPSSANLQIFRSVMNFHHPTLSHKRLSRAGKTELSAVQSVKRIVRTKLGLMTKLVIVTVFQVSISRYQKSLINTIISY